MLLLNNEVLCLKYKSVRIKSKLRNNSIINCLLLSPAGMEKTLVCTPERSYERERGCAGVLSK